MAARNAADAQGPTAGDESSAESLAAIAARLEKIKAYRGRLMPNHAVLAIEFPALLETYEALYAATTLTFNVLSAHEKKFVLLLVVSCSETSIGAHHVKDFLAVGGTAEQVRAALRLAMLVVGSAPLDSVGPGWSLAVPGLTYESLFSAELIEPALRGGIAPSLVELALVAGHATRLAWDKVGFHICRAKALGVADAALAEALTTLILPAGNPIFAQACGVWQRLIAEKKIDASPAHQYAIDVASR
ncbi:MAG: hypothetical protein ABI624_14050 [Casimicrobiaceae bacterium]